MSSVLLQKPSPWGEGSAVKVNKDKGLDHLVPGKTGHSTAHRRHGSQVELAENRSLADIWVRGGPWLHRDWVVPKVS